MTVRPSDLGAALQARAAAQAKSDPAAAGQGKKSDQRAATVPAEAAAAANVQGPTSQPGGLSSASGGKFLNQMADMAGTAPGLADELEWGQAVVRALYGEDIPLSPAGEVVVKSVVLGVGTVEHHAGGRERLKERLGAFFRSVGDAARRRAAGQGERGRLQGD